MEQIKYLRIEIKEQHKEWLEKSLLWVVGLELMVKIPGEAGKGDCLYQEGDLMKPRKRGCMLRPMLMSCVEGQ